MITPVGKPDVINNLPEVNPSESSNILKAKI